MILSGWGRYPRVDCRLIGARGESEVRAALGREMRLIARGNGRSYGDSALNPAATLSLRPSDRLIAFDAATGRLTCEAGALLSDILEIFVARGWFPPVTPGTKFVTVGGMIAADVHGKNHHGAGTFGDHVESLDLALADGRVVRCSAAENAELFEATRGGMGLTGVILRASFRMQPIETATMRQETLRAANLDAAMELFERSQSWTHSVAWIDCLASGSALGRSLFYRSEHARIDELPAADRSAPLALPSRTPHRVPIDFPSFVLNRWSVAAFNELYYRRARLGTELVDYDTFFYPLDAVLEWNRVYGKAGFVQYQCVLPKEASRAGLTALLERIRAAGIGPFLSVLKLFGRQRGLLSFPIEGYTLALDFQAKPKVFELLDALDGIVADHGGRVYLAKDARLGAAMMKRFYGGAGALERFSSLRARFDPTGKFASLQSQRLEL
jgi:FAD/FMN-containing dehydrogenase